MTPEPGISPREGGVKCPGQTPMALTGRQKGQLRGKGQKLDVALFVGKAGASEPIVKELDRLLAGRELVKARFPAGPPGERRAAAAGLAAACGADLVGEVGRTALFYRPNERLDPAARAIAEG